MSGQGLDQAGGVLVSQQPLRWMGAAAHTGKHGAAQATCAMCGTELPASLMVPDGGEACADVRWYCRDTVACTKRWTEAQALRAAADEQDDLGGPDPGHAEHQGPDARPAGHEAPDAGPAEHERLDAGPDEPGDGHTEHEGADDEPSGHPVKGAPGTG